MLLSPLPFILKFIIPRVFFAGEQLVFTGNYLAVFVTRTPIWMRSGTALWQELHLRHLRFLRDLMLKDPQHCLRHKKVHLLNMVLLHLLLCTMWLYLV